MINSSPITPPPELRRLWAQQAQRLTPHDITGWLDYVATQAARWGADQELEACCEWFTKEGWHSCHPTALRDARRPKPPSLKEQALAALENDDIDIYLIRRALETLDD